MSGMCGRMTLFYRRIAETLGFLMGLMVIWQVVTHWCHALFFPTPVAIFTAITDHWMSLSALKDEIAPSILRVTLGWGLAAVLGIVLGMVVGLTRGVADYVETLIHFFRFVPPPAAIPIFLIFFGIGDSMKIFFITFGAIWPILLNTIKGLQSIDATQLDAARVYGIRGFRWLFFIVLPAASPEIFAGLRISLSLAFVLMVLSEMISAGGGIGYEILQSQAHFDILNMWAGMLILGLGGIVFNSLLMVLEAYLLRWHEGAVGVQE